MKAILAIFLFGELQGNLGELDEIPNKEIEITAADGRNCALTC